MIDPYTTTKCPLCCGKTKLFYTYKQQIFYRCPDCCSIIMDERLHPQPEDEKNRYLEHNNDVDDQAYRNFVSPVTDAVIKDFTPKHAGLDFGAGTGPVVTAILRDKGYTVFPYDPYFQNNPELLQQSYDYIAASEVIEHFYNPYKEFALLYSLLKPGGKLYCYTGIFEDDYDFHGWRYKNDQTHVFIYHRQTFKWIKKEFGFSNLYISGRLAVFRR